MYVGDNNGPKRSEAILFSSPRDCEPVFARPYIHAAVRRPIHVHLCGKEVPFHCGQHIHTYSLQPQHTLKLTIAGVQLFGIAADIRTWRIRFDPADEHHHHQQAQRRLGDAHQGCYSWSRCRCMYVCVYVFQDYLCVYNSFSR